MKKEWGFYGRRQELAELSVYLNQNPFKCIVVHGKRKVGKTLFIDRGVSKCRKFPHVWIDLLETGVLDPASMEIILTGHMLEPYRSSDAKTGHGRLDFTNSLYRLLNEGVTVVFDEFHVSAETWFEEAVSGVINRLRRERFRSGQPDIPRGKLVLAGSHQQRMFSMFRDDRPMHGRNDITFRLPQWNAHGLFSMMHDQGLLEDPGKALTLYTAFGGMPGAWHDAVASGIAAPCPGENEHVWQARFMDWYRGIPGKSREAHWNNAAYIELSPDLYTVIDFLASKNRGYTVREIAGRTGMKDREVEKNLDVLENYMERGLYT